MQRFFFDIREGETLISDQEGQDLDGLEAAEREAARAAAEIGGERRPGGVAGDVAVEVRDDRGLPLLVVTVSVRIRRKDPSQEALR